MENCCHLDWLNKFQSNAIYDIILELIRRTCAACLCTAHIDGVETYLKISLGVATCMKSSIKNNLDMVGCLGGIKCCYYEEWLCFSQLYRSSSFNSSGCGSGGEPADDMYSDVSLEEDVQGLNYKVSIEHIRLNTLSFRPDVAIESHFWDPKFTVSTLFTECHFSDSVFFHGFYSVRLHRT